MKCIKCKANVLGDFDFCRSHFVENVERRVKKDIRQNNLIEKDETILVKDPLSRHFIEKVINVPVKIGKKGREAMLWTMDDEILVFLDALFGRKSLRASGIGVIKDRIKLFRTVTDRELETYSKIKGLKFSKKRSEKEMRILRELDLLEKDHKETRFSLIKSIEEISVL
ncbi:MAG: hypothetical protein NT001_05725 [Candidatus Woesearchaeota archaeon]|nr:hypothetical protein [Candidatus Woesearchaeota archaeon]